MSNGTVAEFRQPAAYADALTTLLRKKAHDLLRCAIEDELPRSWSSTRSAARRVGVQSCATATSRSARF